MAERFKSNKEIATLASSLKERRVALDMTLKDIENRLHIDCGQLSRIEAGQFKTNAHNLRKLCQFLQIPEHKSAIRNEPLGQRLEHFAAQSADHRAAAEELLSALERLG